jgi:beta-glucosidase
LKDPAAAMRAAHHLLLGHALALEAMRAQDGGGGRFGITLNLSPVDAAADTPADVDAARRIDALLNRQFLDPLLTGGYPEDLREPLVGAHVLDGDEGRIGAPLDFLGVNYYMRHVVRAGVAGDGPSVWVGSEDVEFVSRGRPRTDMGWEIDADGLHDLLIRLHRDYPHVPLYVTENGAALEGVADPQRIDYLDGHFRAAHRAIQEGVDLRGYFVWSLMDNFEWAFGYSKRFGLIHVDYDTLERTPKDSARWFAQVTRRNGLA